MQPYPFYSPRRRIARAKQHIDSVQSEFVAFFKTNPTTRVTERDPEAGFDLHKVRLTHLLPDIITDCAYDAIEGLRSALDQITHPIAVKVGAKKPNNVHFPIADEPAEVENLLRGLAVQGFPTDIVTLFRSFQPYKGGNNAIWGLNRVRRQGFHRVIIPVATVGAGVHVNNASTTGFLEAPIPEWSREKHEIVLFRTLPGTQLEYNVDLSFSIAFGEVEGVAGEPVLDFLTEAAAEVERVLNETEAVAVRLELFP